MMDIKLQPTDNITIILSNPSITFTSVQELIEAILSVCDTNGFDYTRVPFVIITQFPQVIRNPYADRPELFGALQRLAAGNPESKDYAMQDIRHVLNNITDVNCLLDLYLVLTDNVNGEWSIQYATKQPSVNN